MEKITKIQLKRLSSYPRVAELWTSYGIEAYSHPDGKVTLDFESHGLTFSSYMKVKDYLEPIYSKAPKEAHLLVDLYEFDEQFILRVNSLIEDLKKRLQIEELKDPPELFSSVDKYVNDNKSDYDALRSIYPNILALAGEVIIQQNPGAKWEMRKDEYTGTNEPHIQMPEKAIMTQPLFLVVYKEMFEYDQCELLNLFF